jgi:hypothetical protein
MGMFFGLVAWAIFAPENTAEQQDFLEQLYK